MLAALENVLGGSEYEIRNGPPRFRLSATSTKGLVRFRDQLRDRGVRSAARRFAIRNRSSDKVRFMLNRQAAFEGIIVLCSSEGESALGPIYLTLETRDLDAVLDWLTAIESG